MVTLLHDFWLPLEFHCPSDIAGLSVIADRSSSYFNLYQKDNEIPMEARSRVTMSPFSGKFTGEGIILIATGNGV